MSGPLIPYIKIPEIPLGPLPSPLNSIKPFGVLVATGVYVGAILALRRARQRRLDENKMNSFILYVVGVGFIGAHVFDAIFYTPERLAKDWTYLFQLWAGLSSYGGFIGAIIGLVIFKYTKRESVIAYADVVCSAFPISWVFGRAGCASVHDHPGRETTHWLGMQYYHPKASPLVKPTFSDSSSWGLLYDPTQTVGKFDLGFIEFALTIPLALAFILLWRQRPRQPGFFAGWMSILYAPVRFVLDFFRIEEGGPHEADPRYLGLTPAQFACFGLLVLGVMLVRYSRSLAPVPATWEALHKEADLAEAAQRKREREEEAKREAAAEKARARRRRASLDVEESAPKPRKKRRAPKPEAEPKAESEAEGGESPSAADAPSNASSDRAAGEPKPSAKAAQRDVDSKTEPKPEEKADDPTKEPDAT